MGTPDPGLVKFRQLLTLAAGSTEEPESEAAVRAAAGMLRTGKVKVESVFGQAPAAADPMPPPPPPPPCDFGMCRAAIAEAEMRGLRTGEQRAMAALRPRVFGAYWEGRRDGYEEGAVDGYYQGRADEALEGRRAHYPRSGFGSYAKVKDT